MWFAGVIGLAVILGAAVEGSAPSALVAPAVSRFATVAFWAIAVAAITGTINSVLDLGHLGDLWSAPYGRTLAVKILFFLGILGLGAVNHFFVRRRLMVEASEGAKGTDRTRRIFRKTITIEVGLALLVLALTAMLTGQAPTAKEDGPKVRATEGQR
jgi:putative copper export protein